MIKFTKTIKRAMAVCLSAAMLASLLPIYTNAAPKAKKLILSKTSLKLKKGKSITIRSKGKADIRAKLTPEGAVKSIKVKSSKQSVVKVKYLGKTAYKITAVDEGKAVITVQSLSNKKLKASLRVNVSEVNSDVDNVMKPEEAPTISARQSSEKKIEAIFSAGFADTVKIEDFKLYDNMGNRPVALEKLTLGEDKNKVEIEAVISLNRGNSYVLQYTNSANKNVYTSSINSSNGEVSSIKVNTKTVPVNIAKKISYTVFDENNVDITATANNFVFVKADIPAEKGLFDTKKNELTMYDISATAKITVTYQNGSKKVECTGEISVTKESTEKVSIATCGFAQGTEAFDYSKAKTTSKALAKDTTDMKFFVSLKISDGKEIKSDADSSVKLSSSDNSIFTMTGNRINPVAQGTASIIVEYTYKGKLSKLTPVSVTINDDNAKPVSLSLSPISIVVSSIKTDSTIKVKALIDQYGNRIELSKAEFTFTCLVDGLNPVPKASLSGDTITVEGNNSGEHTYPFSIDATIGSESTSTGFEVIVRG